jgi:hypothetical protein
MGSNQAYRILSLWEVAQAVLLHDLKHGVPGNDVIRVAWPQLPEHVL